MKNSPDVIVVGSGPLGMIAACRIAESGRRVLVLEQGAAITQPPGSHLRNTDRFQDDPDSYLAAIDPYFDYFNRNADDAGLPGACVTVGVGGQGTIWTNNCPRAVAGLERWDGLTATEWERFYAEAESYLGVRTDQFTASIRQQRVADCLRPYLAQMERTVLPQPMAGYRNDAGSIYYTAPRDILFASPACEAIELRRGQVTSLDHDGHRIRGVALEGQTFHADSVVLAAGAFDTPRILHAAGIRPAALGRYLTYHPVLIAQVVLADDLYIRAKSLDLPPRLQIPPTRNHPWNTMVLRDFNPLSPKAPDLDLPPNRLLELIHMCPVDVAAENRMVISDDGKVTFHAPLSVADRARMTTVCTDAFALGERLGRFRAGCEPQWLGGFGFAHVMGTCRMGADDDGTSVADPTGRVWGLENLYLATVGLIPVCIAVNPTLTAAALAVRTADEIVRSFS